MRITFSVYDSEGGDRDNLISLEIFPDMTMATVQESLVSETNIPVPLQQIYFGGRPINDTHRTMEDLGVHEGEVLALHIRKKPRASAPPANQPPQAEAETEAQSVNADPEVIRLKILEDPAARNQLQRQHPDLEAVVDNSVEFARVFREIREREQRDRRARQTEIDRLNKEYFDIEAQRKIEEMIRQERVMENLQNAMEHNPEVFGRVHMLYLDVEVNGHRLKALVDSGAQATIMSPSCAEACGIMRLIDTRFAGVARGVGTANILGRVHSAQIKIGNLFLPCSFTVMEGKSVDLLLGLDMLKRFQATIDLGRDRLIIQGEEVPFLGEADIPKEDEAVTSEPTIAGPSGTAIGQRSGAVFPPQAQGQNLQPPQQPPQQQPPQQPQHQPQHLPLQPSAPQSQVPTAPQTTDASTSATHQGQPPTSSPQVSSHTISQLVAMGASRAEATQALVAANGDVDQAVTFLFGGD